MRFRLVNDKMLLKFNKTSGGATGYSSTSATALAARGTGMRLMTATNSIMSSRVHRKGFRVSSKRHPGKSPPGKFHAISRIGIGKSTPGKRISQRPPPPPCDNSSDSGLGFDQHIELQTARAQNCFVGSNNETPTQVIIACSDSHCPPETSTPISTANSTATSNFFEQSLLRTPAATKFISTRASTRAINKRQMSTALSNVATSSNGLVHLEIVSQPEQQHRARYQTEGSRGAVKDRSGNGFPIVRLAGYGKPTTLQVFIGTDVGRVAPHMFYQACKVAGKNSTQCTERKVDGTMVIEIEFKPDSDMTIICDCVGILKERNVDVEHRFPDHSASKNKKKSTRCRMVFRSQLIHDDGTIETLQICSNPIICTQPPGVPEICKRSSNSCPASGGIELFIIGKNFLKDTCVLFQEVCNYNGSIADNIDQFGGTASSLWQQTVLPDKEYLHQTHLICVVPPYRNQLIMNNVTVQMSVISSGKRSEPQSFIYTPTALSDLSASSSISGGTELNTFMDGPASHWSSSSSDNENALVVETKHEIDSGMMPPPITTQVPVSIRHSPLASITPMITDQQLAHINAVVSSENFKSEIIDDNSSQSTSESLHVPESLPACGVTVLQFRNFRSKGDMETLIFNETDDMQTFPVPAISSASVIGVEHVTSPTVIDATNTHNEQLMKSEEQQKEVDVRIEKFISSFSESASPDISGGQSLFSSPIATGQTLSEILHETNAITSVQAGGSAIKQNLSLHDGSPKSMSECSPISLPSAPLEGQHSNLGQDLVLPQSSTTVSRSPQALSDNHSNLAAEINLTSAVTPSLMCAVNGTTTSILSNIMTPHQVDMASCILNDIERHAHPTQEEAAAAAIALSNIVVTPPTVSEVRNTLPSTPHPVQGEVNVHSANVNSMIITTNANLINSQNHLQQQQQPVEQCHQNQQTQEHDQQLQHASNQSLATGNSFGDLLLAQTKSVTAQNTSPTSDNVHISISNSDPAIMAASSETLLIALAEESALKSSIDNAKTTLDNDAILPQQNSLGNVGKLPLQTIVPSVRLTQPMQELGEISDQELITYINTNTFDHSKSGNSFSWRQ